MKVSRDEYLAFVKDVSEREFNHLPIERLDIFDEEKINYLKVGLKEEFKVEKRIKKAVAIIEVSCRCAMRSEFLKRLSKFMQVESVLVILCVKGKDKKGIAHLFYV